RFRVERKDKVSFDNGLIVRLGDNDATVYLFLLLCGVWNVDAIEDIEEATPVILTKRALFESLMHSSKVRLEDKLMDFKDELIRQPNCPARKIQSTTQIQASCVQGCTYGSL
ncbi:hypothetical protein J6590_034181, partial [Homalodisca vitripennis]